MSSNFHDINNENIDGFNLSKEELMNCFGSQICSQSSNSNYDYQEEYISSEQRKNNCQNQSNPQIKEDNIYNSKFFENYVNKDDLLRNICHGFVDLFFSQKEELKGIKEEIKKLENIMINNNNNKKSFQKKIAMNNQKSSSFNQNNFQNNNELFNNCNKTKKNNFINKYFNKHILEETDKRSSNQLNRYIIEDKNEQKNKHLSIVDNRKKSHTKSPNINVYQKSSIPETVVEVDEEYNLASTNKQKNKKEITKNDLFKEEEVEKFMKNNPEEKNNFNLEEINDEEFDQILRRGKNKNNNLSCCILGNDPFKKSSELKKRPIQNSEEKKEINLEKYFKNNENKRNEKNNNDLSNLNLESDEIVSDFMVGGKKISIKLTDDIRQKINSFEEPIDKLEELDKNKEPSNISHKTSKLSSTSLISKKGNYANDIINDLNVQNKIKGSNQSKKPEKRNYNTMNENSKKIVIKGEKNIKNTESKNIGSSEKDRGRFMKKLKKFGNSNEYNIINNSEILTNKINSKINKSNKIINKEKYMYSTISSFEFYCLCTKKENYKENQKCKICKDNKVININNFRRGFYEYVVNEKKNNSNIGINYSDISFNLLKLDTISEKDSNFSLFKELTQFFNYQFIYLTYDKYLKISRDSVNNDKIRTENLIEQIYDELIIKFIEIFVKGNKSFLTEICESESKFGHINILLFLMNINNTDLSNGEKTIEFSDGYKSCYAIISKDDPINTLLDQMILHNWMNVEIGMWKVVTISEDFKVFIKIYFNSISSVNNYNLIKNHKYGPILEEKYLHKNILDLSNDGGEISLINVIIIKKYNYYVNNITKKIKLSRKKYEDELIKIPESSSDKKNNDNEGKNINASEIKEPDKLKFNFKAIAMDFDIYNNLKKKQNNKNIEQLLKKKYIIEFNINYNTLFESIIEGKMYQMMFLNLEHMNNANNNNSINININKKAKHFFNNHKESDIIIKFTEKSQINEIQLSINYKSEKEYLNANELINNHLNLTNNLDIGKIFIENIKNNKEINDDNYFNKEYSISGIFSGYIDKIKNYSCSEKNGNELGNEEQYIERYIFLSIGEEKVAIIKLHKEDFFNIDVKSNLIKDKIFNCSDILYKEIIYFDNDNNQPKITGRKKLENSIPLLSLETNSYTSISFGNYTKNKEQIEFFLKFNECNKALVDLLEKAIT